MNDQIPVFFWVCMTGLIVVVIRIIYVAWYGDKCEHCKCRSQLKDWIKWHQMKEDDYRGWVWCPVCFHKQWKGFQDRVFG